MLFNQVVYKELHSINNFPKENCGEQEALFPVDRQKCRAFLERIGKYSFPIKFQNIVVRGKR